ncbi:MAG: hypothetical protein RLZZ262_1418 [Bacteroidota bacterium]|jgi:lysophospholipase L1-like esterase
MKTDKIMVFFIALAMLFWNPLSYFIFYRNTPIYSSGAVKLTFWLVFVLCMGCIFLIRKKYSNKTFINAIFTFSFTSLIFGFIVFLNFLMGLGGANANSESASNASEDPNKGGLIFEPNTNATYTTTEFNYTAKINSIGLRDNEVPIDKGDKFRVLCFGDSWTFGWGVELEDSWPKKLEAYLKSKGISNIEVINCGRGGQYTSTYKKYMAEAVPMLKPDMVLVGVLQIDDLAQLYEGKYKTSDTGSNSSESSQLSAWSKMGLIFKKFLHSSTGNITDKIKNATKPETVEIKSNWESTSNSLIDSFKHMQKIRFYALDDSVQSMFKSGNLNPGLLNYYINFSDRTAIFNNPLDKSTIWAKEEMTKDFKEMSDICSANNAKLFFVNMPTNNFTGHTVIRNPSDVFNPYFMEHNNIDSIYRSVAVANNLPYIEMTKHFIALPEKEKYFFKYDGHPNATGYNEIAVFVGDRLLEHSALTRQ